METNTDGSSSTNAESSGETYTASGGSTNDDESTTYSTESYSGSGTSHESGNHSTGDYTRTHTSGGTTSTSENDSDLVTTGGTSTESTVDHWSKLDIGHATTGRWGNSSLGNTRSAESADSTVTAVDTGTADGLDSTATSTDTETSTVTGTGNDWLGDYSLTTVHGDTKTTNSAGTDGRGSFTAHSVDHAGLDHYRHRGRRTRDLLDKRGGDGRLDRGISGGFGSRGYTRTEIEHSTTTLMDDSTASEGE